MTDKTVNVRFELSSGFTVSVKPLPPYYLDFVEDKLPLEKFPMRKLNLASGESFDIDYIPPDKIPESSSTEEYELYLAFKSVEKKNAEIIRKRERLRSDFLLSNCVVVESGPVKFEDKDWVYRLEASLPDYKVPEHPGQRLLAFLKSNVITTIKEREIIVEVACFPEVNLQGIVDALQGFRNKVGREAST